MDDFTIQPVKDSDRVWVASFLKDHWESETIISRGRIHRADKYPGFIAMRGDEKLGLITYNLNSEECEIISLNSMERGIGVGTALIRAVEQAARRNGCSRLWLVTTNDNFPAIEFYQKRNFVLVALYRNVMREYRKLKPELPLYGIESIPIRDEIDLEYLLV
jgi:GNAT superfamily N-acetyltransferase